MEKNNEIISQIIAKPRLLLFLSGFVPIALALISQYGFAMHPCELCIYQRVPFVVVIALAVLSILFKSKEKIFKIALAISVLAFLVNTGIAFFHVGVEEKWWVYGECSASLDMTSIESLKKALFAAPAVRCDDVQFRFLSLSMAGWNIVYSIIAAVFFVKIYRKR